MGNRRSVSRLRAAAAGIARMLEIAAQMAAISGATLTVAVRLI